LNIIEEIFKLLFYRYGPQYWWPAETSFEVIVGAILTQATNWRNVEKAIENLKRESLLSPESIFEISEEDLAYFIRPCGFYKIKAKRLKNFVFFLFGNFDGKIEIMNLYPTNYLRKSLLSITGLGMESVDSILLYVLNRPIFVIDKYTKSIFSCLNIADFSLSYEKWQEIFHNSLFPIYQMFQEYHALIVEHGKRDCKKCKGVCFLKRFVNN